MKQGVVYILKCSNGSFYTGVTNDLEERLNLHHRGLASKFTAGHLPVELVWNSDTMDINDAISLEKQIKGWRQEKKVALINEEYEKLPGLARKYSLKNLDLPFDGAQGDKSR
ncbi:MAG: GIY-YIG nuclease family protein [Candidatus Marinimicrobia bacterium]|nr:GIY-YIG nuclease family protein [Candidatus Neomarinimicrobiota bacterium]MCF7901853.1 GIY-YIG nuclease family protein [Candidatus Neomarinimicrobiota bacterium]